MYIYTHTWLVGSILGRGPGSGNPICNFCVILLTKQPTNKWTKGKKTKIDST